MKKEVDLSGFGARHGQRRPHSWLEACEATKHVLKMELNVFHAFKQGELPWIIATRISSFLRR